MLSLADSSHSLPRWLTSWIKKQKILQWGIADLRGLFTPEVSPGQGFPFAISWAIPMNPKIMASIQKGPNQSYADEYARVNTRINEIAEKLSKEIRKHGYRALPLAASDRTDRKNIKGDFPHKTAATLSGIGWIGKHCQLINRTYGSWIRLGTVFTDLDLPCGTPIDRAFCGRCRRCVDACPAGALKGTAWYPGIPREEIIDVQACDRWKKEHYFKYHKGHNCGICSAVCPYGLKTLRKRTAKG